MHSNVNGLCLYNKSTYSKNTGERPSKIRGIQPAINLIRKTQGQTKLIEDKIPTTINESLPVSFSQKFLANNLGPNENFPHSNQIVHITAEKLEC